MASNLLDTSSLAKIGAKIGLTAFSAYALLSFIAVPLLAHAYGWFMGGITDTMEKIDPNEDEMLKAINKEYKQMKEMKRNLKDMLANEYAQMQQENIAVPPSLNKKIKRYI